MHLQVANRLNKPCIIHTRSAEKDTLDAMRAHAGAAAGVMHCFTESWRMAQEALEMGFYVSISGIVTFKNADNVREIAAQVPSDRLLIETDSPYLAPVPKRGKSNYPGYLPHVLQVVAEVRSEHPADLAAQTSANFHRLFGTQAA